MSAADWIAEQRRIEQAATDGPWMSEWDTSDEWWTIHGQPNPTKGDERMVCPEVATLQHSEDWTADVNFIADARTALPKALAALEAVLALHRRVGIYDYCECDDKNTPEHEDIYEIGVTCNKVYEICAACCRDDVYQSEECVNYHQHDTGEHYCPSGTVVAIAEALGVEP